jgi:hypothetical protein
VTYEARDGERVYRESGALKAKSYKVALKKAIRAKRLSDRFGWEEFCAHDEIQEISQIDYAVLKRFVLDIDRYFDERERLWIA